MLGDYGILFKVEFGEVLHGFVGKCSKNRAFKAWIVKSVFL